MPVFKTPGKRSTGSPIPGVINPSPGSIYPVNTTPTPGQFANQPVVRLTGNTTAPIGKIGGQFGNGPMSQTYTPPAPTVTQTVRRVPSLQASSSISGSAGRGQNQQLGGGLNYTTNIPIVQTRNLIPANTGISYNTGRAQQVQQFRPQTYPTARFDTERVPNTQSPYQNLTPRFDTERAPRVERQIPTPQLSRVNDKIVSIGGRKYFAPTLANMIGGTQPQTSLVEPSTTSPYSNYDYSGYSSGYPYYGYGGNGYSGSSYAYQNSAFANVLNWRLATG